ncbi:hypothetical protein D3C81_1582290 [compost metagenome]
MTLAIRRVQVELGEAVGQVLTLQQRGVHLLVALGLCQGNGGCKGQCQSQRQGHLAHQASRQGFARNARLERPDDNQS